MKTILPLALASLLALGLAACGRRGPLEPPPDTPQGQLLAKQRANANARRGLGPDGGPKDTPEAQAEAARINAINIESDARNDDARSQRAKEAAVTPEGEVQAAFPSNADLIKPPQASQPAQQQSSAISPKGSGRKPPPIQRPDRPFILDGLLD